MLPVVVSSAMTQLIFDRDRKLFPSSSVSVVSNVWIKTLYILYSPTRWNFCPHTSSSVSTIYKYFQFSYCTIYKYFQFSHCTIYKYLQFIYNLPTVQFTNIFCMHIQSKIIHIKFSTNWPFLEVLSGGHNDYISSPFSAGIFNENLHRFQHGQPITTDE